MLVELVVSISLIGSFTMLTLIILRESRRREARQQRQAELSHRVLERFSSAEELSAFLQTEAGRRFLDPSPRAPSNPKHRIIGSTEGGIIVGLMGLGFLFVAAKHEADAIWPAMILLGLSAGLLISAFVGYQLSKKWGIFDDAEKKR